MSTPSIHPTAIVDPKANIGPDVTIGPYCVIGPDVALHEKVTLKSHVCIEGHTEIGAHSTIYPFASIGTSPQDLKYAGEKTRLVIGTHVTIREHVTMNPGTVQDQGETRIGDNCLFMMASHVAHDCLIGNNVILANNATLGGHVHVGDNVVIGGLAAIHQFVRIGDHAIIGGMSGVDNDVIPYGRVKGERAHLAGLNLIGLERRGFDKAQLRDLQKAFKDIFHAEGTLEERLDAVSSAHQNDEVVMNIIHFAQADSKFPLCQPLPKKRA